jgi:hypothetical protein
MLTGSPTISQLVNLNHRHTSSEGNQSGGAIPRVDDLKEDAEAVDTDSDIGVRVGDGWNVEIDGDDKCDPSDGV